MLTYDLILFILLIIVFILFNNFPKKNKEKILPCGKKLNELTDEEYIEYFLPYIIQRWEEREKAKGMSLEEYIDKYVRTENKGICTPLRLSIEELKHNSITDEEFFDTYLLDIIKDWENNEKPNGISLNKYFSKRELTSITSSMSTNDNSISIWVNSGCLSALKSSSL